MLWTTWWAKTENSHGWLERWLEKLGVVFFFPPLASSSARFVPQFLFLAGICSSHGLLLEAFLSWSSFGVHQGWAWAGVSGWWPVPPQGACGASWLPWGCLCHAPERSVTLLLGQFDSFTACCFCSWNNFSCTGSLYFLSFDITFLWQRLFGTALLWYCKQYHDYLESRHLLSK